MEYAEFLQRKRIHDAPTGLPNVPELNPMLFGFQRDIVRWALKRGRAAIFADCGMGKTPMQLEWAERVAGLNKRVMIVAPLAVSKQTIREGEKFGVFVRPAADYPNASITITNYEQLHKFNPNDYDGIVLDESSILKSYTGKFRTQLIEDWGGVPFRLCCTATPAPNDFMELGNHAEFLGAMTRTEMLAFFFVHDGGETQKWRLKGHAESEFWRWLCSWAVMIRKPSDLGYDDGKFTLPSLHINQVQVETSSTSDGMLFALPAHTMDERRQARRDSIADRVAAVADMVNGTKHPWLVWCDRNDESTALVKAIKDAVEVRGSHDADTKEDRLLGFSEGRYRVIVTKPSIAGWGMNWQHCSHVAFTGLSDSYEQFYQAVRRCWRFGQKEEVNCYVVTSATEGAVVANIQRKERQAEQMASMMVRHMSDMNAENIKGTKRMARDYSASDSMEVPSFL